MAVARFPILFLVSLLLSSAVGTIVGPIGPVDVFPHPMPIVPGDIVGPPVPLPVWDHPHFLGPVEDQFLHPLYQQMGPGPSSMVVGPGFVGTLNEPFCLYGPESNHIPYHFHFWNEPVWQPIGKGEFKGPNKPPMGRVGHVGNSGQIIPWWTSVWNWGNTGGGNNVIPRADWDFATQWAGNGPAVPPGKINPDVVVPEPKKLEVKSPPTAPQVPPAVKVEAKTPVEPIVLPPQPQTFDLVKSRSNR